jgi:type IX secretion system PorP/SprF family membrane protein
MRNYIFFILFLIGCVKTQAQQEAHYSQFMYNNLQVNPGFAGSRRVASFNALYRNQWIGFKGNPRSFLAGFDMPLPNLNKLGLGVMVSNQSEGIINRLAVTPSVSYAIIHTDESTLRVGISASYRQYKFDLQSSNVNIRERQDPNLSENDNPSFNNMNIGMGIYYDRKNIYAGFSIPNLNENPLIITQNTKTPLKGKENRHFYGMVGGLFPIGGNENLQLKPSMMFKYVANAPFSVDANMSVLIKKKFMGGLSYRFGSTSGDSVDLLTFAQVSNNFAIGMAYDFTLSQIGNYNRNSIEILARYDFALTPKTMHNPRFFF